MDKERLRIPSDSSSGSSSRGAASPNPSFRNGKQPNYVQPNNIGPPPNSPASFSVLPQPSHSLPPPPGLPHPNLYHYPPSTGFQNLNYPLGMPAVAPVGPAHLPGLHHFPSVSNPTTGQYNNVNRFGVQNGMMQAPTVSPPPGYSNYFGNLHSSQRMHVQQQQQPCSISSGRPFPSQYVAYNETGDPVDLEQHINLLLGASHHQQEVYSPSGFNGGSLISSLNAGVDDVSNGNCSVPYSTGSGIEEEKHTTNSVVGGVMNPIIENIVGSINNGAYTHFGPAVNSADKIQNGPAVDLFRDSSALGRHNGITEMDKKTLFSKVAVNSAIKEPIAVVKENVIGSISPGIKPQPINPRNVTPVKETLNLNDCVQESFGKSPSPVGQPRASSPKEAIETSSRPQTPGKPSYLEVLTKAGLKSQQNSTSSIVRKTSSTSSSPVQSAFSVSDSVPNLCHRKSVDYFIGSTSSPSSSCPSASSSPATKPRNLVSGILLKGKENVSAIKQGSSLKNSPSNSPSHFISQPQQVKVGIGKPQVSTNVNDRKVLATQNNSATGVIPSNSKGTGKLVKNGKVPTEKSLELDIDETNDEEWGWKTYAPRGRNNNLNSVGNKNPQKRTSNGHCSSDPVVNSSMYFEDDEDTEGKKQSGDDVVFERKSGSSAFGSSVGSSTASHSRKLKDKEKPRSRKDDRHCLWRRMESYVYIWLAHMISALTWLWSLVTDVATLSASLGMTLMQDFYEWTRTKALPNFMDKITRWRKEVMQVCYDCWTYCKTTISSLFSRGSGSSKRPEETSSKPNARGEENILSLLGPERNITLPANGDEALKRLLSVKGQDPYSILGVRSDSSDETIRRYYKRQAVLVHPDKNLIVGAEEAFKILARAFEMVGDPIKRAEYHQKLMEAQAKEKFCGEIGNLLEQLRKKMEAASSTIRCTKCNSRHKKNITDRPLFAARFCSQCRIHHGAREGELWAERGGWFGIAWNYFACMDAHVWEINEWARCQKTNLKHIKADAHCVMYRLVAGGNNHQNHSNQHCHGNGASFEDGVGSEADEWDSLINNLYNSPGTAYGKTTGVPGKTGCCSNGNANGTTAGSANQAAGRRRKGKRSK